MSLVHAYRSFCLIHNLSKSFLVHGIVGSPLYDRLSIIGLFFSLIVVSCRAVMKFFVVEGAGMSRPAAGGHGHISYSGEIRVTK